MGPNSIPVLLRSTVASQDFGRVHNGISDLYIDILGDFNILEDTTITSGFYEIEKVGKQIYCRSGDLQNTCYIFIVKKNFFELLGL